MSKYTIYHGDCLDELRRLENNSVDSVVTDPPYGLSKDPDIRDVLTKWIAGEPYDHGHGGFMGKTWDSFVPHPDVWKEVYRVLKPGGHALIFAGTRTQDFMTVSLRLGGFEIRDVIEWLYFSGFPKSMDVGKKFDKNGGSMNTWFGPWLREERERRGIKQKDLAVHFPSKTGGLTGCVANWELGLNVPTPYQFNKLCEVLELPFAKIEEAAREKVGEKRHGDPTAWYAQGESIADAVSDITAPATELARKWDGWGTALKPAHEPIIVARKPLAGTVADNVEKHGTGAINIDGCRIGDVDLSAEWDREWKYDPDTFGNGKRASQGKTVVGRFPANCITTDEDAFYSPYFNVSPQELSKKASKRDRNADWHGEEITHELKTTDDGRNKPIDNPFLRGETARINSHPTVKPVDLMAWLIRLVTPAGGTTLDPYAGSGSTLVAAKSEGFGFIGIEREGEYVEIIEARTGESRTISDEEFEALLA